MVNADQETAESMVKNDIHSPSYRFLDDLGKVILTNVRVGVVDEEVANENVVEMVDNLDPVMSRTYKRFSPKKTRLSQTVKGDVSIQLEASFVTFIVT